MPSGRQLLQCFPCIYGPAPVNLALRNLHDISQEACSALVEVLSVDVGISLSRLWKTAMSGDQLTTFCKTLEEQVRVAV